MQHIEARHQFEHSADKVWDLTGDFAGLKNWLPGVAECTVEGSGAKDQGGNAMRTVQLMDGSVAKESLESLNTEARSYRYRILSAKGFDGSKLFLVSFKVQPLTEERCEIIWKVKFEELDGMTEDAATLAGKRIQMTYQFFLRHLEGVLSPDKTPNETVA